MSKKIRAGSSDPAVQKIIKAEKRIEDCPFDIEAWNVLIRDAQGKKIEEARPFFERLVVQFPTSGRFWRLYIECEMRYHQYEKVEKLFQRCLIKVLNIDLWKCYLNYVKETKGSLPSYREKMAQAYDFALDKMGMDVQAHQIWVDYIEFLKGVEAVGTYAENQRITAVRKVYQRGCLNPMAGVESLWKDYCSYENGVNPLIAKKMIDDRSRDHMNVRRVAKDLENITKDVNRNLPAILPNGSPEERKQVENWKKYIEWEKSNPMRCEDHQIICKRVMFAVEQALLILPHHPDIWYEGALFLEQTSKTLSEKGDVKLSTQLADEAAALYERALGGFMKKNMLLHFAFADYEESRLKYPKVHQIYNAFLETPDIDPTLAYIQFMKFARRAEGIKAGRAVFKKAREDTRSKHHVFVAAALMEYYCSKDKQVAFKIFELGLKKYSDNAEFILCYIDYLSHLNEENNTRVLFEKVLSSGSIPPEKSLEIWTRFLSFESAVGDLSSVVKIEKRRAKVIEAKTDFSDTTLLVDRYRYLDLFPVASTELKALGWQDFGSKSSPSVVAAATTAGTTPGAPEETVAAPTGASFGIAKPDLSQMIPFKPKRSVPAGTNPVPGGEFPVPPLAANLLTTLPPPNSFTGPFVLIDQMCEALLNWTLPEDEKNAGTTTTSPIKENGVDRMASENGAASDSASSAPFTSASPIKEPLPTVPEEDFTPDYSKLPILDPNLMSGVTGSGAPPSSSSVNDRKRRAGSTPSDRGSQTPQQRGGNDSDDDDEHAAPPVKDIYRARQMQKKAR